MLRDALIRFRNGEIPLEEAARMIEGLRIEAVGEIARLDIGRSVRCGMPEVVLGEGKEADQLAEIAVRHAKETGRCIITRISSDQFPVLNEKAGSEGLTVRYNQAARAVVLACGEPDVPKRGTVAIITAGTSDIGVAEEARVIAEEMGCGVRTAYDVGAAGIHRLFPALRDLLEAQVFIVAAGREGTLPAVVAGLVDRPVIGVPVSSGYGYMGGGRAALASMLQSCSVLVVVNIDAGFTAGAFAARVAQAVVPE